MGSMCLTTVSNLPRCIPTPALLDQTSYSPELLENLGDLEIWKENYDASAKYMEKALAIYEQRQDTKGIASVLRKQAGVAYRLDEYGRAKALASAALEKLRTLDDDLSTADTLVWLASSLDMEFKLDKAITYFEEALEIFRIHGRDVGVVRCLERLGEMFRRKGDFDKASGYLEDALVIASQVGDKVGEARATKCLGYLVWDQGDLEKAFATLQSASEMSRHLGLEYFVCEILQNLGTIRLVQENYQEAERLLRDSIPLAQKTHQVVTLAMSLSDLGCTRWKRGDIAEAEVLLEKARSTFQKTTFRGKARIGNLADLASLKAAQGDQVAALSLYDQAIAESRSLQLKPELSLYLEKKGLLLEEGRRYDEAALCFEASLVLDQELDSTEDVRNDIKLLACLPKTAIHDLCNRIASNVY
ncbi:hypothetical protein FRB90_003004 [Tulasnella sp. 427]|nr:hypothetical protein FRB90_003004 [Tulasnella sp. 427]